MNAGAEKNKLILLAALCLIAAYTVYSNFFAGGAAAPAPVERQRPAAAPKKQAAAPRASSRQRQTRVRGQQFRPSFTRSEDEPPLDPMEYDPTLRTDLLAKVKAVEFSGVERNIFQFTTRKPKEEPPKPEDVKKAQELLTKARPAPPKAAETKSAEAKPRAPRIPWKYYGYAAKPGDPYKRAFLLDGEEILVATEGDVFRGRYRIVRIGINSIVVEDMQFQEEQTLPLEQQG